MISRRARFALAAMLDLARRARGRPLPAKALAEDSGLAPRQFETVLQDLVRAGLLRSVRGPQGGYELARERRRISVGAVVRAIDGPPPGDDRPAARPEPLEVLLSGAAQAFLAHLDATSIEDLCGTGAPGASADFSI